MDLRTQLTSSEEPLSSDGATGATSNALAFGDNTASKHRASKAEDGKTNFDKIIDTDTSFERIHVSLYKSRETGLKVMVADVEVPIVDYHKYAAN